MLHNHHDNHHDNVGNDYNYVDYGDDGDDGDYDGFVLIVLVERSISRSLVLQGLELPHRLASISFYVHHLSVQTIV